MQNLFDIDAWRIIEHGFDPSKQQAAESIFSIGNVPGQRANFEEHYGGASLQGSYRWRILSRQNTCGLVEKWISKVFRKGIEFM